MSVLRLTRGQGQRGKIFLPPKNDVCIHDISINTSLIVTKLVHMNLTWNRNKEFEDKSFATDSRSRLNRPIVQNIDVRE